ncbi:MAG TPA: SDR family NAD(P)-dependent oxidoreductase [Streptosporangiaceae bacterium]|jgi:NAD(P)-dependent dehydrogenase (short-subunit alcohol dehydrogenase family)
MSVVFITGSADGLGLAAGRRLAGQGHQVIAHARSEARAADTRAALPGAVAVVTGDLSSIAATRAVAAQVNALGRADAVIHNAGVGYQSPRRVETADGLGEVFAVNVLAPYLLTALITPPGRLIYLSSGMHRSGEPDLTDPQWARRRWNGPQAYSDSKLFDVLLAFAVARRWPRVRSNSVDPGWVATRMGGPGAPGNLELGTATQAWLAVSDDPAARVSGGNFYHLQPQTPHPAARSAARQDELLDYCAGLTGTLLPPAPG